jgi:hypothetical protein
MGKQLHPRQLIPPPANWRPVLLETARDLAWINAAGLNANGSAKTRKAHGRARANIRTEEALRVIKLKTDCDRTPKERNFLQKCQDAQLNKNVNNLTRNNAKKSRECCHCKK